MKQITPNQFKEAFLSAVSSVRPDVIALWDAKRDYTALMLDIVFPKIAAELNISVFNGDYYHLDSIFYSERDAEHFGSTAIYATCISIAMEHENDPTHSAVEMNKLQLFNAPLKVLITYAGTPDLRRFYLDRYTKIIQSADIFGDFATLRRQLVIFGSLAEQTVTWHFHLFGASGFQAI